MFERVTFHASDREASQRFYDLVLGTLEVEPTDFAVVQASGDAVTRRVHVGFVAESRDAVHAFWQAGVGAGHPSDGEPGPRPQYSAEYYGGFLLDPDGNSAEAVHRGDMRRDGSVDHIWLRVPDLAEARGAYEQRGLTVGYEGAERVRFGGDNGSISLVLGEPSENVDIVFS
jgi:catechol 2,3-dioxygenase-like lactoylglutathione lyase family enzyme